MLQVTHVFGLYAAYVCDIYLYLYTSTPCNSKDWHLHLRVIPPRTSEFAISNHLALTCPC